MSKYVKKEAASRQIFVNPFLVGDVEIASFTNKQPEITQHNFYTIQVDSGVLYGTCLALHDTVHGAKLTVTFTFHLFADCRDLGTV